MGCINCSTAPPGFHSSNSENVTPAPIRIAPFSRLIDFSSSIWLRSTRQVVSSGARFILTSTLVPPARAIAPSVLDKAFSASATSSGWTKSKSLIMTADSLPGWSLPPESGAGVRHQRRVHQPAHWRPRRWVVQ